MTEHDNRLIRQDVRERQAQEPAAPALAQTAQSGGRRWSRILGFAGAVLTIAAIFLYSAWKLGYQWNFPMLWDYRFKFFSGFLITLAIGFFSLFVSLTLGALALMARRSRFAYFRALATLYIEGIRGTPLMVQIMIFFYIVGTAFSINNKFVAGVLILSLFAGAYVAEILRGGLASIPEAQMETARSLCFSRAQTWRLIILPQLARIVLPALAGQFASLIKDSSILSIIAVSELTKNVTEATSLNFRTFENYLVLAVGYLIITLPISRLTRRLERSLNHEA